jgi:8-oxo-dGTP pyrophosphatase MutT (NUDIX family)
VPETETDVEAEWVPGPDGIPFRNAARAVILDSAGNLLLIEGHDGDDVDHRWWFTVGGGIAEGEDPRVGAVREIAEETGFAVRPDDLVGPVGRRSATFRFVNKVRRQDEEFFLLRVAGTCPTPSEAGWTSLERDVLDQMRWLSADELDALVAGGHTVYPLDLPALVRRLLHGWDGTCVTLSGE